MIPIIEVNNLGKKYKISTSERERYIALRDVLSNLVKSPGKWFEKKPQGMLGEENPNEFLALNSVNFHVEAGEVLGIIGRNGAGKSTLLKILSQITPPTSGEIKLRGRVGSLLEVGTGFHPELSGRENIFLNGAILGMRKKEIEKKFNEIVEFAGIEKFLDLPVKRYSSGMYVRLAFAVAAHLEPDILIIDEVLAVGDSEFQKKCLIKMNQITKEEGRTVLFVSHSMEAVKKLCTRCVVLDKGSVVFDGDTEEAITMYNSIGINKQMKMNNGEYGIKRRGSGTLSFTNIEILDIHNIEKNIFHIGEKVKFKMSYKVNEEMVGLHVNICLFSNRVKELPLTDIPYEIKEGVLKKDETGQVIVEVELSNIRPGEYMLYFWLGDANAASGGSQIHYDVVDNLTEPLIILENEERKMKGFFSLPSQMYVSKE